MQIPSAVCKSSVTRTLLTTLVLSTAVQPCPICAQGQEFSVKSYRDGVCDIVILADGTRLPGIAINDSPTRIVLRTERLKTDAPDVFANEVQPALAIQLGEHNREIIRVLQLQIDRLKINAPDDLQQIGLLEEVTERLNSVDNQLPQWVIAEIKPKRLKRIETLAANRRELAMLALLNHIDDFEGLHWKTVTTRLQAIPAAQIVRPASPQPSVPPEVMAQRILAAIDVRLNKATRLIRTGSEFVVEDANPDMAILFSALLGDSLNGGAPGLLNETGGEAANSSTVTNLNNEAIPEAAIRLAEKDGYSTVVISSFEFDIANGTASVTRRLFRNTQPGEWNLISSAISSSTTEDVTQKQIQTIEGDPQVVQISRLLTQFSPDPNALKTAVQMGGVVQSALWKADADFQKTLQDILTARRAVTETPPTVALQATSVKSCPTCDDDE